MLADWERLSIHTKRSFACRRMYQHSTLSRSPLFSKPGRNIHPEKSKAHMTFRHHLRYHIQFSSSSLLLTILHTCEQTPVHWGHSTPHCIIPNGFSQLTTAAQTPTCSAPTDPLGTRQSPIVRASAPSSLALRSPGLLTKPAQRTASAAAAAAATAVVVTAARGRALP